MLWLVAEPDVVRQKFQDALRHARRSSGVSGSRPRQSDRRTHRLQPRFRAADRAWRWHALQPSAPNDDGVLRFISANLDDAVEVPVADLLSRTNQDHWTDYPSASRSNW